MHSMLNLIGNFNIDSGHIIMCDPCINNIFIDQFCLATDTQQSFQSDCLCGNYNTYSYSPDGDELFGFLVLNKSIPLQDCEIKELTRFNYMVSNEFSIVDLSVYEANDIIENTDTTTIQYNAFDIIQELSKNIVKKSILFNLNTYVSKGEYPYKKDLKEIPEEILNSNSVSSTQWSTSVTYLLSTSDYGFTSIPGGFAFNTGESIIVYGLIRDNKYCGFYLHVNEDVFKIQIQDLINAKTSFNEHNKNNEFHIV